MQVPASFDYQRATSAEHALSLLRRYGPEARLIAGGHSLIPMMKLRLAQPEVLVDINDLSELSYIRITANHLCIGAMTRHAELAASPLVAEHFPMLKEAEAVIADPIVRNRGTVGGSLCQADPSEDLSAAFSALDATFVILGEAGPREVGVEGFHLGPYTTAVGPDEMLTEVKVPLRPAMGSAYEKLERRAGDWAVAAAAAALSLQGGVISEAGVGLAAVGAPQFRSARAAQALVGNPPDEAVLQLAAEAAAQDCNPAADQRGPQDYKRHLVTVLSLRALRRAAASCQRRI